MEKLEWNKVEGDRRGRRRTKENRESVTPAGTGKKLAAIIIYSTSCFLSSVPLPPPSFFPPSSSLSKLHLPRVVVALNPILGALLLALAEMPAYWDVVTLVVILHSMDDVDVRESRNRNGETHGEGRALLRDSPTDSPFEMRSDSSFGEILDWMV